VTDKHAQIDRFGSHRRSKIKLDGTNLRLGLWGRRHKVCLAGFGRDHVLQIQDGHVAKTSYGESEGIILSEDFLPGGPGRENTVIESSSPIHFRKTAIVTIA
jgi:hypothetical protein